MSYDNLAVTAPEWIAMNETQRWHARIIAERDYEIAHVFGESKECRAANAQMMAASLNLYQALHRCIEALETINASEGRDIFLDTIIDAKAAMKKARGGK
jgi:hypothetical protein